MKEKKISTTAYQRDFGKRRKGISRKNDRGEGGALRAA